MERGALGEGRRTWRPPSPPQPILWHRPGSVTVIFQDWEVKRFLGTTFERMACGISERHMVFLLSPSSWSTLWNFSPHTPYHHLQLRKEKGKARVCS